MTENMSIPLVKDKTTSESQNVFSILFKLNNKKVYIPDYQRDADQWDERKKSLFLESLLNNLTIPAFFFCEVEPNRYEVVDGQQRLLTIWDFAENKFRISDDADIDYLLPLATKYRGKTYNELPQELKDIFNDYPLTIIYLPKNMELGIKLEIFRRINEGGTPLTGQDIRLAYYSESSTVTLIRLAGIYNNLSSERMKKAGEEKGVSNPWDNNLEAKEIWYEWWEEKQTAKGQTPSLMFLWYIICLDRNKLDSILTLPGGITHLKMPFRGSIEESLDIYCAQLKYQEYGGENVVSTFNEIQQCFDQFAYWINQILSRGLAGISVDKYKQLALFIAGAVELKLSPQNLTDQQWNTIGDFIRKPRNKAREILGGKDAYPEPRGKWGGPKGQKIQCDKAVEIVSKIMQL
ncbi:MAG: DUF262 domain-containing protein [Phormidium sp.]